MDKILIEWCENLKKYWLNKDIDNIINLFYDKVEYYETPFQKISDLKYVWNDIYNQEINDLKYRIMAIQNNIIIANYILILKDGYICNMVYEIELNEEDKCIKFVQWYMESKNNE